MTATTTPEPVEWTLPQKIAFRFFAIFFIGYIFLEPNGVLPFSDHFTDIYFPLFHQLIPWLAAHVLHMAKPVTIFTNGSGDTTYDYLAVLFVAFVAAIGTAIWSVTGRNTKNYNKLFYWVCVIVRYYMAITMVVYGSVKVVKLQFPEPTLGRLMERVGDMSPMGLAWTYVGHSVGFNTFTGLAELSCGLLLFFRRTTTLGAILGVVVAGNIMAINYCFDVPVKILATTLVAMSIFLLFRDYHRLVSFFFTNQDAKPANLSGHRFRKQWKNIVLIVLKYILIAYVLFADLLGIYLDGSNDDRPKPKFYGIYDVQYFVRGHDTLPPLTTDTTRWRHLVVGAYGYATTGLMNDSMKYYGFKADTTKHVFIFTQLADTSHKITLNYIQHKPDTLLISGLWLKDSVKIKMIKYDLKKFRLLNNNFRWVNEYPINR